MASNLLEYKGYHAKIEFSSEDNLLIGKVCWVNDSLTFEGETISEITEAFRDTIDEYLAFCKEIGKEPDKEFKGSLNIRMPAELHRAVALNAAARNQTINQFIVDSLQHCIDNPSNDIQVIADAILSKLSSHSDRVLSDTIPYQVKTPFKTSYVYGKESYVQ